MLSNPISKNPCFFRDACVLYSEDTDKPVSLSIGLVESSVMICFCLITSSVSKKNMYANLGLNYTR